MGAGSDIPILIHDSSTVRHAGGEGWRAPCQCRVPGIDVVPGVLARRRLLYAWCTLSLAFVIHSQVRLPQVSAVLLSLCQNPTALAGCLFGQPHSPPKTLP